MVDGVSTSGKILQWFTLLGLACLTTACGQAKPLGADNQLVPIEFDAVVLAFGDSLTAGVGASPDTAYPAVLSKLISRQVINDGISGEETKDGLRRLPASLDQYHPALVILCEGGNDLLRQVPPEKTIDNLRQMVGLIEKSGAKVLLVAVPTPSFNMFVGLKPDPVFFAVANTENVALESKTFSAVESDRSKKSDLIHPNVEGYDAVANGLADFLRAHNVVP